MANEVSKNPDTAEAGSSGAAQNNHPKTTPATDGKIVQHQSQTDPGESVDHPDKFAEKKTISERRWAANQRNSQKSTGPKTTLGKSRSRMNSTDHGMLARRTLFSPSGRLKNPELLAFYERLCAENHGDDLFTQFLNEDLLHAYAGYLRGLECEQEIAANGQWQPVGHEVLARYMTRNRNAIQQNFKLLRKLKEERTQQQEEEQEERERKRELELEREMELEYQSYRDACNLNSLILSAEEMRSDYVPPNYPRWGELEEKEESTAALPTPAIDHKQQGSPDLPRPADRRISDSDSARHPEKAEPPAGAEVPPSDAYEPEAAASDRDFANLQPSCDSPAIADQLIAALRIAEPEPADLADQQTSPAGDASPPAEPDNDMDIATLQAALDAVSACVLAQPAEEEEDAERPS